MYLLAACLAVAFSLHAQTPATAPAPGAQAPGAIIERIEFDGNRRIRSETLQGRIFTRAGDSYNPVNLQRDFQALWNTQYFDDITLEVQDSPDRPNAKIIIFHVSERPVIRRIEYHGNKSISESDILDRYKDAKVGLAVEGSFDPTKIEKAAVVIRDLEGEHGHQFATVKTTYEKIPATAAVKLIFTITEGPKVKVGTITFIGNSAFSRRRLLRSMRKDRPYAIPLELGDLSIPVMAKTFDKSHLDEDMELGIRALYQNNGYFSASVGGPNGASQPQLKTVDVGHGGIVPLPLPVVGKTRGKATNITIAIEEGEQYRMGKLVIRSADPDKGLSLKREYLEGVFPLKKGEIFDVDKIRKAIENYTKLYGVYGYIDFTATPMFDVQKANKTIDLTLDFDEQKQFFVRRIDFSGNTTTRDKVIRRELLINEGDIFNDRYWELSLLRLNQLNYFDAIKPENADIKRNTKEGSVDILLKLKEKGKQTISFTGGVSGLEGSFIGLTYQTNNFLGLGETLTLSGQLGNIQSQAVFSFTEPYLFDRPISTGFSISTSKFTFNQSQQASILYGTQVQIAPSIEQDYNQNSTAITLFASYPVRKFSFARLGLQYSYSDTSIAAFSTASTDLFESVQFQSLAGPSALSGIHASSISPSITYNTVNNPTFPTSGKSAFYSFSFTGGPLGGNVKSITNTVELKYFHPNFHKRNVIALHFVGQFATGWGGLDLPPFNRLYLGGENDLRGFDIRTVTPIIFIPVASTTTVTYSNPRVLDSTGAPTVSALNMPLLQYQISFPGGDTSGVFNGEYRIPIAGPVSMSLFFDAGSVGIARKDQLQLDPTGYSNLTSQFPGTSISRALTIDPGTNFKLRTSAGVEFVVRLPVIGAPFRLYWAYNFTRVAQQIVAPAGTFQSSVVNNIEQAVGQTVFQSQILPQLQNGLVNPQRLNFFEPLSTFRFAVSRTF